MIEGYNRYAKRIEAKNMTPDRKEKLISPGRDIIVLVLEVDNAKRVEQPMNKVADSDYHIIVRIERQNVLNED